MVKGRIPLSVGVVNRTSRETLKRVKEVDETASRASLHSTAAAVRSRGYAPARRTRVRPSGGGTARQVFRFGRLSKEEIIRDDAVLLLY